MELLKRTFAIPSEVIGSFEQTVSPKERDLVVSKLLQLWLAEQKQLRREIIEGCQEMAEIYLQTEREYHPLEEEVQRDLEIRPKARRHRPRSARPGRRV